MQLIELRNTKTLELAKGVTAQVVHTANLSIAHVTLLEGSVVPQHAHHHEQVVNVIEGELELIVEGVPTVLTRGKALVLPPMVPHSARAITEVHVIDVFHPAREDFKAMAEGSLGPRPYGKK
jgi:quercetin dioxygenase-like cupin family protein